MRRRRHRLAPSLAAAAAMMALVGCSSVTRGSLASGSAGALAPDGSAVATGAPGIPVVGGASGVVVPGGTTTSGTTAPSGTGGRLPSGTSGGSVSTTGDLAGTTGAKAGSRCKQTLKLGWAYSSDEGQLFGALGHPEYASSSSAYVAAVRKGYQLGADDLNNHGGLAGCKVALVDHDFSFLNSDGYDAESQKECADYTQDQHVFAAFTNEFETKVFAECMAQRHVPVIWYKANYVPSKADLARYRGYLYEPSAITPDRLTPVLPSLAKAGYFDAGSKIGILLADDGSGNNQRLVDQIWKPQLAAMNLSPSVFKVSYANSTSSLSNISSQYNSAILQFQTAGVNHVLFTPDTGTATFLFPPAAESQHFRPRYAMTTHNYPAAMSGAPQGQADRSMAVSWSVEDVSDAATPTAKIPGIGSTAERRHCDQLYTKYAAANATPTSAFYPWCDFLGLLKKALATTTTVPTAASLLKGIEAVGSGFEPAMSYGPALFGPKHYDGGSFMRVVKFDPAAKAYKLGSPAARIP